MSRTVLGLDMDDVIAIKKVADEVGGIEKLKAYVEGRLLKERRVRFNREVEYIDKLPISQGLKREIKDNIFNSLVLGKLE